MATKKTPTSKKPTTPEPAAPAAAEQPTEQPAAAAAAVIEQTPGASDPAGASTGGVEAEIPGTRVPADGAPATALEP
jgi:hypothetical protein